jgi:hypothetical protein
MFAILRGNNLLARFEGRHKLDHQMQACPIPADVHSSIRINRIIMSVEMGA